MTLASRLLLTHLLSAPCALGLSLCTKGTVSLLGVTTTLAFLPTPSPSVTSTCDWQREQIPEKPAIFPHGMVPQDCLFPGSGRKVSMTTKSLMFTPHQLTCLPPRWYAGYCVKIILQRLANLQGLFIFEKLAPWQKLLKWAFLFWFLKSIISIKQNKLKLTLDSQLVWNKIESLLSHEVLWGQN